MSSRRWIGAATLFWAASLAAQAPLAAPVRRITQAIDETQLTRLSGNTHPLAQPQFDRGAAPAGHVLNRMLLVLKRSDAQESALHDLLLQQQAQGPLFHQWLTPQQFGAQFGAAPEDVQTVTNWLASHGFAVTNVDHANSVIEFSGNAAQLTNAFHTEIHQYVVNGQSYWANNADPSIPSALAPVIAGFASLNNFPKAHGHVVGQGTGQSPQNGQPAPALTFCAVSSSPCPAADVGHALVPVDFDTIYNVTPLYSGSITGLNQSIAVVARTDINHADISDFRYLFLNSYVVNLPNYVYNGPNPGIISSDEESEADLDTEWSGSIAPNATVNLVISAGTDTTDGIDLSLQYIVNWNLAPVVTSSFGLCEAALGTGGLKFYRGEYEQAAAQGQTVIVSAGDQGAAGCDQGNSVASNGLGVNGLASTPFNVAMGGAQFCDGSTSNCTTNGTGSYWNSTSSTTNYSSVKSYIPEAVWNQSCSAAICGSNAGIDAGGGGASQYFGKPAWQVAGGVPNDSARDLPDLSLAASSYDGYVICQERSCELNAQNQFQFYYVGGTSAAAPSFASIMALVNQKTGAAQGLANLTLYKLAPQTTTAYGACASSSFTSSSTCNFIDITSGNNAVPCTSGTANCSATTLTTDTSTAAPACGESTSGAVAYTAGVGYDCASGLGTVDVANLVNNWSSISYTQSSLTMALSVAPGATITHGQAVTANFTVAPTAGPGCPSACPTGDVALLAQTTAAPSSVDGATLSNGKATLVFPSASNDDASTLPGGSYNVYAHYEGDNHFAPSTSAPQAITVLPESSTTVVQSSATNNCNTGTLAATSTTTYGSCTYIKADTAGNSGTGIPTGTIAFTDNGASLTSAVISGPDGACGCANGEAAPYLNGIYSLAVGVHSIVATYAGDVSFKSSVSAAYPLTVTAAPTSISITSESSTAIVAQVNTAVLSIQAGGGAVAPTGTVTFFANGSQIGNVAVTASYLVSGSAAGDYDATATLNSFTLPAGSISITATYSGDTNYATSTTSGGTQFNSFYMTPSNPSPTVTAGASISDTVTVFSSGTFTGAVSLSCSITTSPAGTACGVLPATVTLTQNSNQQAVATVSTTARTSLPPAPSRRPTAPWLPLLAFGMMAVAFLGLLRQRRLAPALLLAGTVLLAGCGGSSTPASSGGTPAGTYVVTVTGTASGGATETTTFTLTVQ